MRRHHLILGACHFAGAQLEEKAVTGNSGLSVSQRQGPGTGAETSYLSHSLSLYLYVSFYVSLYLYLYQPDIHVF